MGRWYSEVKQPLEGTANSREMPGDESNVTPWLLLLCANLGENSVAISVAYLMQVVMCKGDATLHGYCWCAFVNNFSFYR